MRPFWLGLIGLLSIVYTANSIVDVSGLDSFDAIYRLSKAQTSADILAWDQYFDQRPWLKAKLDDPSTCPRVLILGSSSVGTISAPKPDDRSLINGWLTNGGVEELEAATAIMEHSGCRPETIVLGMDPWFFNRKQVSESWRSLSREVSAFRRAHGDFDVFDPFVQSVEYRWQAFKERLTYSSTLETVSFVLRRVRRKLAWRVELVRSAPDAYCRKAKIAPWIRAADGHYHICTKLRRITPATAQAEAESYVTSNTRSIREWDRVEPERLQRLRRVVATWRSWDRSVVLVAPPMHPTAFAKVMAVPKIQGLLAEMDAALTQLSAASGARYVNLRDPRSLACRPEQFRDGHHSDSTCAARMLDAALAAGRR